MKGFLQCVGPDGDTVYMNLDRVIAITDNEEGRTRIKFDIGEGEAITVDAEQPIEEFIKSLKKGEE